MSLITSANAVGNAGMCWPRQANRALDEWVQQKCVGGSGWGVSPRQTAPGQRGWNLWIIFTKSNQLSCRDWLRDVRVCTQPILSNIATLLHESNRPSIENKQESGSVWAIVSWKVLMGLLKTRKNTTTCFSLPTHTAVCMPRGGKTTKPCKSQLTKRGRLRRSWQIIAYITVSVNIISKLCLGDTYQRRVAALVCVKLPPCQSRISKAET